MGAVDFPNPEAAVSGSSFYAAMRVLPSPQRRAMFAIYAFCRAVDDVADGHDDRHARLAELAQWRCDIGALYKGGQPNRVRALTEPVRAFDLQCDDLLAIIDGMEMDARAEICAPDLATVELSCVRVCLCGGASGDAFSRHARAGRGLARLPSGQSAAADQHSARPGRGRREGSALPPARSTARRGDWRDRSGHRSRSPALGKMCVPVVDRARGHFAAAHRLMAKHPLRLVRAPRLMAIVYENILERLAARG